MFVDLSIEIREGMVFRKGSPPFALEDIRCLNEKGLEYETSFISTPIHIATHIDVMTKNKPIGPERFIGEGFCLDLSQVLDRAVTIADIPANLDIKPGDFVLIHTNWSQYLGTEKYLDHPELSIEILSWLADKKINMVGIDAPGLGKGRNHQLFDKYLVERNVYVIENLTNLELIKNKRFTVYCFPLNIHNVEAYPARVVVEL